MPLYLYENKKTGEVLEVLQGMNDIHEYNGEGDNEKGLWRRVYVNPGISFDTKVDVHDESSFIKSTANKNDTYGDLFNRSKEASEIRSQKNGGVDPIKEKYYSDYRKERNGKRHPQEQKEIFNKSLKKAKDAGINVEL